MGKEILTFADIEIEKNEFYRHKCPIEKVLVSNKISSDEEIKLLHINVSI